MKNTYWTVDEMEEGFGVWHTGLVRYGDKQSARDYAHFIRCKINSDDRCWSWNIGPVGDVRVTERVA